MKHLLSFIAPVVWLMATPVAGANAPSVSDPAQACNQFDDPVQQIKGCTDYIRRSKTPGVNVAVAYMNRGIARAARGDTKRALADFAESIRLAPDNPFSYYNRANLYYDRKDYKRAISDYSVAIERDEDFMLAYFNRGLAYEKLGDQPRMIADFKRALELDPEAVAVRERLNKLRVKD